MSVDTDLSRIALSVKSRSLTDDDIKNAFRVVLLSEGSASDIVLTCLLEWLAEYTLPPADAHELARYAGKREVAFLIKAQLYSGDIS